VKLGITQIAGVENLVLLVSIGWMLLGQQGFEQSTSICNLGRTRLTMISDSSKTQQIGGKMCKDHGNVYNFLMNNRV
jgi:hypothetical protein